MSKLTKLLEIARLPGGAVVRQMVWCNGPGWLKGGGGGGFGNLQGRVHLLEGAVRLAKEVIDDAFAEFALAVVVVHLEDLLESVCVDDVFGAGNRHDVATLPQKNSV